MNPGCLPEPWKRTQRTITLEMGPSSTTPRSVSAGWSRVTPFMPLAQPSIVVLLFRCCVVRTLARATANWIVWLPPLATQLSKDPVPLSALVVTVHTEPPAPPVAATP